MALSRRIKKFVEENVELIEQKKFRQLFLQAYNDSLMTVEVLELHEILFKVLGYDSTALREQLLLQLFENHVKSITPDMYPVDLCMYIRHNMNNTFGFYEPEALELIFDHKGQLKIRRTSNTYYIIL